MDDLCSEKSPLLSAGSAGAGDRQQKRDVGADRQLARDDGGRAGNNKASHRCAECQTPEGAGSCYEQPGVKTVTGCQHVFLVTGWLSVIYMQRSSNLDLDERGQSHRSGQFTPKAWHSSKMHDVSIELGIRRKCMMFQSSLAFVENA
jgi:hypothetical protein